MNIGDKTKFGILRAIHTRLGERSYFFTNSKGDNVTLIPGDLVEHAYPGTLPEWMKRRDAIKPPAPESRPAD